MEGMASPAQSDQDPAVKFGRKVAIGCVVFLTAIIVTVAIWVTTWNKMAHAHRDQLPSNGLPAPKTTKAPPAATSPQKP
jgi:hypothetical protein